MGKLEKWYNLTGKVIFLTGATGKLGPNHAEVLSECGADVVVTDLAPEKCERLAFQLRQKYNTNPLGIALDITRKKDVRKVVSTVVKKYGKIDILINNAVYCQTKHIVEGNITSFEDFPFEVWKATLDVNLTGIFFCCQEIGKIMVNQGHGIILNISSVYGVVAADQRIYGKSGLNSNVAYAATKGALINFTRYLASWWQGKNIRVNCLSPGGVFNHQDPEFVSNYIDRTMLKRMADVDDLSAAILYLISDASKFVTGTNLIVDGGWVAW
jgi:NAD(P)-dependent dehydrogenase (short-subunit alcohol dehydrogenase family)